MKIPIGFLNHKIPSMLTALHHILRDFLDYSHHLNKIHLTTSSIDKFIQKDFIVPLKQLSNKVLLLTYKFSSE